jgi:hypothetical protein
MFIGSKNCAFLTPVTCVHLNYITKKAPKLHPLLDFLVLQAFDSKTKIVYAISVLATIVSWYLLSVFRETVEIESKRTGIIELFLIAVSIQTSVSASVRGLKSLQHRIFLVVLLILALVMCNAFQGLIVSRLTQPPRSDDINTLEELIQRNFSLKAMVLIPNLFKPNEEESNVNEIQKQLYKRQRSNFDPQIRELGSSIQNEQAFLSMYNCLSIIESIDFLSTVRDFFAIEASLEAYDESTGEDLIHILKEAPISFFISYNVPKTSPFIQKLNLAIIYAIEFGIVKNAHVEMMDLLKMKRIARYNKIMKVKKEDQKITVDHLRNVFTFYFYCVVACCCTFLTEIFIPRLMKLNRN